MHPYMNDLIVLLTNDVYIAHVAIAMADGIFSLDRPIRVRCFIVSADGLSSVRVNRQRKDHIGISG